MQSVHQSAMDHTASPDSTHLRLLVVEDDDALRSMLLNYLEMQGLQARGLRSAQELGACLVQYQPDLIVMDVGLPGISGLTACQKLRASGNLVPVILLTARTEEVDRVLGLEMGADDYVGKPFSARELLARIHAILRRTLQRTLQSTAPTGAYRIGRWAFYPEEGRLTHSGEALMLRGLQRALLQFLVANPVRTFTRDELLNATQGSRQALQARSVDTAVMRLRKLLEPEPDEPRFIQTVRGQGYVYLPSSTANAPSDTLHHTANALLNTR